MRLNLEYDQNEMNDLTINAEFEDSSGEIHPIDLTGIKLIFTVKQNLEDPDSEAKYQQEKIHHEDAEAGISIFPINTQLTGLPTGSYYYDIRGINAEEIQVFTLLKGKITITKGATGSYD